MVTIEWLPLSLLLLVALFAGITFGVQYVINEVDKFILTDESLRQYRAKNLPSLTQEQFQLVINAFRVDAARLRFRYTLGVFLITIPMCIAAAYVFLRPYRPQIQAQLDNAYAMINQLQVELDKARARFRPVAAIPPVN
jgi:hypothetical protein